MTCFGSPHMNGSQRDYSICLNRAHGQKDKVKPNGGELPTHFSLPVPVCAGDGKQGELAQCWRLSNTDVQTHAEVLLLIWSWSEMGEFDSATRGWGENDNWSYGWKKGKQSWFCFYGRALWKCRDFLDPQMHEHNLRLASTAALNKTWWICCRGCLAKHSLRAWCALLQTERAGEPVPLFRETGVCRACARWHLSLKESRRITQGSTDKWI